MTSIGAVEVDVRRETNARLILDGRFDVMCTSLLGTGAVRIQARSLSLGLDLELTIDASVLEEVPSPAPDAARVSREYAAARLEQRPPSTGRP